jgi:hypothetical protein
MSINSGKKENRGSLEPPRAIPQGANKEEGGAMILDKAIKILNEHACQKMKIFDEDLEEAEKLGIEALKRLQDNRRDPEFDHWVPLPGETQEEPAESPS